MRVHRRQTLVHRSKFQGQKAWALALGVGVLWMASPVYAANYILTVNVQGFGSVSDAAGVITNSKSYPANTVVTLTATPSTGYLFGAWSGAVTGATNTITVTMNSAKSVTAIFGTQLVHVAPQHPSDPNEVPGSDENPGTEAKPVATLKKAIALIDGQSGDGVIVIHAGTYTETVLIPKPTGVAAANPDRKLLIRAADNEKVTFDGGSPLLDDIASPMPGVPGVYTYKLNFKTRLAPGIWEEDIRVFYSRASTFEALKAKEYTFMMLPDRETVAFHPKNGEPLQGKHIRIGLQGIGVWVYWRNNVTIQGLSFRNYQKDFWATSIYLDYANNCVIDGCNVFNAYRGFMIKGENAILKNSHVVDTVTGVYVSSKNATVEYCRFERATDRFRFHVAHVQDDSGIHYYSPAQGGTVRFNTVYGYTFGTFFKSVTGTFIVEHNTFVYGKPPEYLNTPVGAATHQSSWTPDCRTQYNIMYGYPYMRKGGFSLAEGSIFDHNIVFCPEYQESITEEVNALAQFGGHNQVVDPLLAMPAQKEFHLLPQSPALTHPDLLDSRDQYGPPKPAGAWGVVSDSFAAVAYLRVEAQLPVIQDDLFDPHLVKYYCRITKDRNVVLRLFANSKDEVTDARIGIRRFNDSAAISVQEMPFTDLNQVTLPDEDGLYTLSISVRNRIGWSDDILMHIRLARQAPVISSPQVLTNTRGALVCITSDRPVNSGSIEFTDDGWATVQKGTRWTSEDILPAQFYNRNLRYTFALSELTPGKRYEYRIKVADIYAHAAESSGSFIAEGTAKTLYVAPDGLDADDRGTASHPFKTLQYAYDRVLPGDSIVLKPGVYFQSGLLNHGGTKNNPITIAASEPQRAIFDGLGDAAYLMYLFNAPHVIIRDLNLNSFLKVGVSINQSSHVTISGCQIVNSGWEGADLLEGDGIFIFYSPNVQVDHCVLARLANGIFVYFGSDRARIVHNTLAGIRNSAILFIPVLGRTLEGSEVQYNCIAFTNISAFCLTEGGKDFPRLSTLSLLDYNNYATRVRDSAPIFPDLNMQLPLEFPYYSEGKQFVTYTYTDYVTHEDISTLFYRLDSIGSLGDADYYCGWREFSGKDEHTIVADPRFVDPEMGRFDLRADSPNLRDDLPDGSKYIGAIGYLPDRRQPPIVTLTSPQEGGRFSATATITFKAEAWADKDGTIANVGFYMGTKLLKECATAPYTHTRTFSAGEYKLRAMATDNSGLKTATPEIVITVQAGIVYGDVSGDGQITAEDARRVARYAVELIKDPEIPGLCNGLTVEEFRRRGDVDGNPGLSANDAMLIAKRAVGLIDRFPVEKE